MFVKEWTVTSGWYPVFRGGWFCETSFIAKKCEDFGWNLKNRPIFKENRYSEGPVLRNLTVNSITLYI
jgi:hypothetical protein